MANNRLILRTLNSPWLVPLPDVTKGSVLTHAELDNNFLYLKGEVIYSASTINDEILFHKINGENITVKAPQNYWVEVTDEVNSITTPNTVYVPKLNVNDVNTIEPNGKFLTLDDDGFLTESSNIFEGTWEELNTIKQNNGLIIGSRYLLTDYQTQYIIEGTDSSDLVVIEEVIGQASGYAQFENVPTTLLFNGDTATIYELPDSYSGSLSVGDTVTVTDYFNSTFIKFSPSITTPGIKLSISKQRYPNVTSNTLLLDSFGKPILKPQGVLNIDVHDGTPYLNMLAEENPIPPIEQISIIAISENQFSLEAESLTFIGDKLRYDFEDINLLDGNGTPTGQFRKGFILGRENLDKTVNINKDWRVQRYRRYKMDDENWSKYTHDETQITTSGSTNIYLIDGLNNFTTNLTVNEEHKYICKNPYEQQFYIDFTNINENPFISGVTNSDIITRVQTNTGEDILLDINLPFSGLSESKDFFILPITNNDKNGLTERLVVGDLTNTIFLDNTQNYGSSAKINIFNTDKIYNSSFMTGLSISSYGPITSVISIDRMDITNTSTSTMDKINILVNGGLNNSGSLYNLTIGGSKQSSTSLNLVKEIRFTDNCLIRNSMLGGRRWDRMIIKGVMSHNYISLSFNIMTTIHGLSYLNLIRQTNNSNTIYSGWEIDINSYTNKLPGKADFGYIYDLTSIPNDTKLNNFNDNKNLVYTKIDSNNNIQLITQSTPQ
tara:strand:- start:1294 stop:3462 length:2169 start_codon:yes stop_codon:yes gene_type:complete